MEIIWSKDAGDELLEIITYIRNNTGKINAEKIFKNNSFFYARSSYDRPVLILFVYLCISLYCVIIMIWKEGGLSD